MSGISDLQDSDPTITDPGFISHFGFRRAPFQGADLDGFYSNQGIERASATLLESMRRRAGLLALIGVPGAGKTLLLRKLMQKAPAEIEFVLCHAANLDFDDLLGFVCARLGLLLNEPERSARLEALKLYLDRLSERSACVALLLDEAHKLPPKTLARLLDLSAAMPSLLLVLSGAPLLERRLERQKIDHPFVADAVYARLQPFALDDVAGLIAHRLEIAGKPEQSLFPPPVIERIAYFSKGIPRRILTLADQALRIAFAAREKMVTVAMIDQAEAAPKSQDQESKAENTAVIPLAQNSTQSPEVKLQPQPPKRQPAPRRLVLSGVLVGVLAGGFGVLMLHQYDGDRETLPLAAQTAAPEPAAHDETAAAPQPVLITPETTLNASIPSSTSTEPAQPVLESTSVASEAPSSIASYMHSGDRSMELGDVIAARRFYEAAADAGEAAAAIALGKTYDPVEFSQRELKGLEADPIAAAQWYRKALETDHPEARERLDRLKLWSEGTADLGEAERRVLRDLVQ